MNPNKVAILMPTIWRANRMKENVENLYDVTSKDDIDIIFIIEKDDVESIEMSRKLDAITLINQRARNFAGAVNTAVRTLTHNYFFGGSDDFLFHKDWLPPLLELSKNYGMVGTNDLGNPQVAAGELAVSYLVRRDYVSKACIGNPENLLYEGYMHNFTDTELTETAIYNKEYVYCPDSIVEHMHPAWGKSPVDETYKLQDGTWGPDTQLFFHRRSLWGR